MGFEVDINTEIVKWAVGRAGFNVSDLSDRFPKLQEWINAQSKPTVKQLEDLSKKVHIPFGYFFLNEPPQEKLPFPYFRSIRKNSQNSLVSLNVYDTIQLIQRRQDWLTEYLKDSDFPTLSFVGSAKEHNVDEIVANIKRTIGIEDGWAAQFKTIDEALNYLTQRIEEIGIIVVFNGVVENNNSRPISVEECRGFVLVNSWAPFMFVNNADSKGAQMFTIAHEIAHIWLGKSAGFDFETFQPADDPVERLCDQIAAEFLVPERSFLNQWSGLSNISALVKYFKVSPIVLARRALDLEKIGKRDFFQFYRTYVNQLQNVAGGKDTGGNFYATQKKRISLRFAGFVRRALNENKLMYREAYRLTGIRGDTFQTFMKTQFG